MTSRPLTRDADRNALPQAKARVVEIRAQGASETARDEPVAGRWTTISRIIFGTHFLALADQAVVSGASLLSTVLVGRFTVPSQLGVYTIGISILGSVLAVQDALILLPYMIQRHRPAGTPAEHAGIALLHSMWLAAAAALALAVAAIGMIVLWAEADLTWLVLTLVLTVPFAMQREFNRTYAFAHLNMANAFALDASAAALQLSVLGWLGLTGRMSAVGACAALGGACGITSFVWLYRARSNFSIRKSQVRQATAESWRLGKWLCAGQITVTVQSYVSYWMLPLLISMAETGVYAACNSIASLANPLLTAFRNTLTPRSVLAFKEGGAARLRRQASRDALLLVGVTGLFCLTIIVGGETLMRVIYHGPEYGGQGHVVTVLAFAVMAGAAGSPASNALASMERPRAIVLATSVGTVVSIAVIFVMSARWGLLGAAYGMLAGNGAGSVARWVAFLIVVARPDPIDCSRASVARVLEQFSSVGPDSDWQIRTIGEGFQGRICGISTQGASLWQDHRDLVVKLYPAGTAGIETAKRQFIAQTRLHVAVDGKTVHGWTFHAPRPLHVSASPPALVMTMSAGTDLNQSLAAQQDAPSPDTLEGMAHALVGVLKPYWSAGCPHGDLCLQNILWNPADRVITLIDADAPVRPASDVSKEWYPASCDLASILCDVATDIRTVDRRAALRKRLFAESVLRAFVATVEAPEDKKRLIGEIRAFAQLELASLNLPWSPQGAYHLVQRKIAAPRIDRSLADALAGAWPQSKLAMAGSG